MVFLVRNGSPRRGCLYQYFAWQGGAFFRNIPLDDLREHLDELERDKPVYVNCQTGLRSYLACRLLTQYGFSCSHLSGGYSFYQVVTKEQQTARGAYPCGMEKL